MNTYLQSDIVENTVYLYTYRTYHLEKVNKSLDSHYPRHLRNSVEFGENTGCRHILGR